ncbi:hypothetical protein C8K66_10264 [Pseudomonas sp. GV105]|uniref:hypothetical protein n=1 Tax=Pseudomonas sp. GV105 TaxID=2135759 RepID=UPI000D33D9FD|nr:hypothetical protein [Pseudomonas sp. GV105]PUB36585.1 hypothetical protein C8K66_10264 [Pseudomonas sp. GV105]
MTYAKPESYTDADWEMVQGYMRGKDCLPPQRRNVAYMHGYMNGKSDASGIPHERCNVLIRRANMIPGITPMEPISTGDQP